MAYTVVSILLVGLYGHFRPVRTSGDSQMAHSFVHKSVYIVVVKAVLGSLSYCKSCLLVGFFMVYKHGQGKEHWSHESQTRRQ